MTTGPDYLNSGVRKSFRNGYVPLETIPDRGLDDVKRSAQDGGHVAQPAPGTAGPSPLTARRSNAGAALALAFFGALLAFLDATIVDDAFPDIQTSFPRSPYGALSWV